MIRKVVQISQTQARMLKSRARREGVSESELVRRGIDCVLGLQPLSKEARERAMLADLPHFSDAPDVGVNHDEYLAEIYADDNNIR